MGSRFRFYAIATGAIMIGAGVLTSLEAPNVPANLPTHWLGTSERVSIGAWLLWVDVLAVALLCSPHSRVRVLQGSLL